MSARPAALVGAAAASAGYVLCARAIETRAAAALPPGRADAPAPARPLLAAGDRAGARCVRSRARGRRGRLRGAGPRGRAVGTRHPPARDTRAGASPRGNGGGALRRCAKTAAAAPFARAARREGGTLRGPRARERARFAPPRARGGGGGGGGGVVPLTQAWHAPRTCTHTRKRTPSRTRHTSLTWPPHTHPSPPPRAMPPRRAARRAWNWCVDSLVGSAAREAGSRGL